jgi:hypothetical protein
MIPRVLRFALVIAILPLLLGADSITLTKAIPNPGNPPTPQLVEDQGTYTLANLFVGILARATNTATKQINSIEATIGKDKQGNPTFTWDGTLQVVKGNYDCDGVLQTTDGKGNTFYKFSNVQNVNVN